MLDSQCPCSHNGCCCCQSHNRGTAQCNEQDYQGRLAGIVWYQRKSSQWGIFRQHSRSFIHCLHAQSDSAHSPAVKPCHYPLVCFCLAGDRPLLLLACVSSVCALCTCACVCRVRLFVCVCLFTLHSSSTHLRLVFALQAADSGQIFCHDCCSHGNALLSSVSLI